MKRLIFLNRYFFPDHSATSQMLSDLAFHLAKRGKDVHVITSQQLYDYHNARLPAEEIIRGVHIHRIPTTRFGRSALLGRGLDYLSFYASTWRSIRAHARQNDILIAKTDPPLLSVVAMFASRRRGVHLVNWLQDLYPEVATQLGVPLLTGPVGRILCLLRNKSLNAAAANVVVGDLMGKTVALLGVSANGIHVIPNWTDDQQIYPISNLDNPLRRDWGLQDKFVVGYSGNLGRAHEYHTILSAAERLRNHPHIVFLFVGGGYHFDELARAVKSKDLSRTFRFVPYQNQEHLNYSLGVPDVHWISLRPEVDGLVVPSKFYGIAAAGKPIIAITAEYGEIAQLVKRGDCGIVVEPGNAETLAAAIVQLSLDEPLRTAMGRRARTMLEAQFTREHAFNRWRCLLDNVESLNRVS